MALLGATTATVTRCVTGSYVDGDYTSTTTTLDIRASVQPISGFDLQRLPEAERTQGRYKLYTDTQLFTSREEGGQLLAADTVEVRARQLRVMSELDWVQHVRGVPHYKYILGVPDGGDGL